MSIRCDWLVLCQRVIEDTETRNLTLVDCLDRLVVPRLPCRHSGFAFAAYFSRDGEGDAGTYDFRLVRRSEGKDDATVFEGDGEWPADIDRMRVFVNFAVIRLTAPGVLRYRIDWRVPKRRWTHGPEVAVRVEQLELSPEERDELEAFEAFEACGDS